MMNRLLSAEITNIRQRFSLILPLVLSVAALWLTGCRLNPLIDEFPERSDPGVITMHQTGGFAGVSRTISIGEKNGLILLVSTDQRTNHRKEVQVSREGLDQLWQTLEANDVFTILTDHTMLETVRDGFFFDVTVHRGGKSNRFSVYTPDLLVEGGKIQYNAIVQAIEHFADSQLEGRTSGIAGIVTNPDGKPAAGMRVMIVSGTTGFPEMAAETNEMGSYQIGGISEGTFEVAVYDKQGNSLVSKSITVRNGELLTLDFVIPTQAAQEYIVADMPINSISVQILESFPLQVHLVVNGFLRDGCTTLNEITQQREGNTIRIHITTKRPKDAMCAQVITEVAERIPLQGGFLPGRYKVFVNNVEEEFEI